MTIKLNRNKSHSKIIIRIENLSYNNKKKNDDEGKVVGNINQHILL